MANVELHLSLEYAGLQHLLHSVQHPHQILLPSTWRFGQKYADSRLIPVLSLLLWTVQLASAVCGPRVHMQEPRTHLHTLCHHVWCSCS